MSNIAVGQIGIGTVISGSEAASCTSTGVTTSASGSSFEIVAISVVPATPIVVSVQDSKSNTYTRISTQINDANVQQIDRFLCTNGTGGSGHTATATVATGTASWAVFLVEITGGATSSLLDQSNKDTGYLAQPWSPGNIVLGAVPGTGELMVTVLTEEEYPGTIQSESNGFVIQVQYYNRNFGNPPCAVLATKVVTSNGTYTSSFTTTAGGSTNTAVLIDSFLGASSSGTTIVPTAGALTISGKTPTVTAGANTTITPGVGGLTLSGQQPTQVLTVPSPGTGALVLAGYAPTFGAGNIIVPSAGTLTLSGYAPTLATETFIVPAKGTLTFTGYAPTVTNNMPASITPNPGALTLTGYAPTVGGNPTISPGTGALTFSGHAPHVTNSGMKSGTKFLRRTRQRQIGA